MFETRRESVRRPACVIAGTRGAGVHPGRADQRYTFAYIFAAVGPGTDNAFALVLPEVSTEAMQTYLDGLAEIVAQDEHLVLMLDQADWHVANHLEVPHNITLELLPPRARAQPSRALVAVPQAALSLAPPA